MLAIKFWNNLYYRFFCVFVDAFGLDCLKVLQAFEKGRSILYFNFVVAKIKTVCSFLLGIFRRRVKDQLLDSFLQMHTPL